MKNTFNQNPILAIATAPGKGGVGVVRFSFPKKSEFHTFILHFLGRIPKLRHATYIELLDGESTVLDQGIALVFDAPASFTGEYVLEFQGHGGQGVLQAIVARALDLSKQLSLSLRYAEPGEFTRRAFLNDKIDLVQAEAVADLINANTLASVKAAALSLTGAFSKEVHLLADKITHLRLLLEATLDFPEEEIDFLEQADAYGQLNQIMITHSRLMQLAIEGQKFNEGIKIALIGKPNVGKSSLLNVLSGQDVSIVTDIPGTTRDRIEQVLHIRGLPITLVDTAGIRQTQDEIEKIGIQRTHLSIQEADLLLYITDDSSSSFAIEPEILELIPSGLPILKVFNKVDLYQDVAVFPRDVIAISAKKNQGLQQLKDRVFELIGLSSPSENRFMARQRHIDALKQAEIHLINARQSAVLSDRSLDLFAEELRLAHNSLGEITGYLMPDDLLGLIFSRFCIGK